MRPAFDRLNQEQLWPTPSPTPAPLTCCVKQACWRGGSGDVGLNRRGQSQYFPANGTRQYAGRRGGSCCGLGHGCVNCDKSSWYGAPHSRLFQASFQSSGIAHQGRGYRPRSHQWVCRITADDAIGRGSNQARMRSTQASGNTLSTVRVAWIVLALPSFICRPLFMHGPAAASTGRAG